MLNRIREMRQSGHLTSRHVAVAAFPLFHSCAPNGHGKRPLLVPSALPPDSHPGQVPLSLVGLSGPCHPFPSPFLGQPQCSVSPFLILNMAGALETLPSQIFVVPIEVSLAMWTTTLFPYHSYITPIYTIIIAQICESQTVM